MSASIRVPLADWRNVRDPVARPGLLAAAETRKVGRVDAVADSGLLQVESPLDVTRRAEAMDEQHRRATPTVGMVHAQRSHVEHAATERLRGASKPDHSESMRAGARRPVTSWPDSKRLVLPALITVTAPGPIARQVASRQSAALRSSMPRSVASGSACCADSTQRWPKVSKCGSTAVSATSPSASVGRRLKRFGQLARMSVWLHSAIAPAEDPASAAPSCQASVMAFHTLEECSTCATRPGSPPTR